MKVLLINGSPRPKGNISLALSEMEKVFMEEGIETEMIRLGSKSMQGCIACRCSRLLWCS
ncbi:MAG: NAD(P)H-dependent oxidoreductase [Treponema sp.]|nr:NAD(P)H-dependent oxidoreductase [Treponema sp.]